MEFKKILEDVRSRKEVWESDGEKCPGPDGLNFKFIQECWDILEEDFMKFVRKFYEYSTIFKAITAPFIALIQKKNQ